MLKIHSTGQVWEVLYDDVPILAGAAGFGGLEVGLGNETISMHHGNFEIVDSIGQRLCSTGSDVSMAGSEALVSWFFDSGTILLQLKEKDRRLHGTFATSNPDWNRFWLDVPAQPHEHIYGCGEQFSYFDLRGRTFPLWTREQGVGRNKSLEITRLADEYDHAGGDYHTTFYPQTTFVSSQHYFLHARTYAYAEYDFSDPHKHRLHFWKLPDELVWSVKPTIAETVQDLSALLGRQSVLPAWIHDGMILGIQDGTRVCAEKLAKARGRGVLVNGIWAQDWEGQNFTSFGKRLLWNWEWNKTLYPDLDAQIPKWRQEGVHFLGYINPYVLKGHSLCNEAEQNGLLALDGTGNVYYVDFGEFWGGIVDFTNPKACEWYKEVIKQNLIDFGLDGWMADFGEYLPTDVVLHNGMDAREAHNAWPGLWARINREAVQEAGAEKRIVFFMRAGNADSLKWCPMMWAGDQNVDWSEDDGLPSALTGSLSLAMCGMGLHHSDIGGYTTLLGLRRSKELLLRWAEFAACTPMMRSHEGNRPSDNWQFDTDDDTLERLGACTRLFVALKDYRMEAVALNAEKGLPVMRPLYFHYEEESMAAVKDEYLLGRDLLVAPVFDEGAVGRTVLLPHDEWVDVWTGITYDGGRYTIDAPLGRIPLFYRAQSPWAHLFKTLPHAMEDLI